MTSGRLRLAAIAGLLVATGGCASVIAHAPMMSGHRTPPTFAATTAREVVDAELGAPVDVTPLPDGGQVASYRYRVRPTTGSKVAQGLMLAELFSVGEMRNPYLWLFLQPVLIPTAVGVAITGFANPTRDTVTFTYGPHGELLHAGRPPAYGPRDDAVASPPLGTLRASCRTDATIDHAACVARRLAIWGLD